MIQSAVRTRRNAEPSIQLYSGPEQSRNVAYWRVNGYPARVIIWTQAEWERLEKRPPDAQYLPSGLWCVLRIDDR
jgi:hypothetical protein